MGRALTSICAGFILIAVAACDRDDIDSFISVDVKEYNEKIVKWKSLEQNWPEDPVLITRKLFQSADAERKTVIDFEAETEGKATVILTQEKLSDDSVYGEKRIIEFEKIAGSWIIKQIRVGFKCQEFRGGHTSYSGIPCP